MIIKKDSRPFIPLYEGIIPNAKQVPNEEVWLSNKKWDTVVNKVSVPELGVFLPSRAKATGAAVVICPGGGYHTLVIKKEGTRVARAFNQAGVAAFVLKYRLPDQKTMPHPALGPFQDAQQAIKVARQRATEWHIDPDRIGIMGFSAGGHLAATIGVHFRHHFIAEKTTVNLRPDFMILIYPVISFADNIGNTDSKNTLLGTSATAKEIRFFSNELHITPEVPPTFLAHAVDDEVVSSDNSLSFYNALRQQKVPVALHLYQKGEHGFISAPTFDEWFGRCLYWMRSTGCMK